MQCNKLLIIFLLAVSISHICKTHTEIIEEESDLYMFDALDEELTTQPITFDRHPGRLKVFMQNRALSYVLKLFSLGEWYREFYNKCILYVKYARTD
ncbi:MAG: hypothetical protein WA432_00775 [Candidatus Babeliaceae bacterium]